MGCFMGSVATVMQAQSAENWGDYVSASPPVYWGQQPPGHADIGTECGGLWRVQRTRSMAVDPGWEPPQPAFAAWCAPSPHEPNNRLRPSLARRRGMRHGEGRILG